MLIYNKKKIVSLYTKNVILLVLATLLCSCGKKSSDANKPVVIIEPPVNLSTKTTLARIIVINSTDLATQATVNTPRYFYYNANNQLTKADSIPYTYDVSANLTMIGIAKKNTVTVITNDANGAPVGSTTTDYNASGNPTGFTYYDYTITNGKVTAIAYSNATPLYPNKTLRETYAYIYDAAGNITQIQTVSANSPTPSINNFKYGTHNSQYFNSRNKYLLKPFDVQSVAANELLESVFGATTLPGVPPYNSKVTYSYNYTNNFPVTALYTYSSYANTNGSYQTNYKYDYYNLN